MKKYLYEVRITRHTTIGCMPCATLKEAQQYVKDFAGTHEYKIVHNDEIVAWSGRVLDTNTGLWVKS